MFFDKPSKITLDEWINSKAYQLLKLIDFSPIESTATYPETEYIHKDEISLKYKGILIDLKHVTNFSSIGYKRWWKGLTNSEKEIIKLIPNFDREKFYKITSIDVNKD